MITACLAHAAAGQSSEPAARYNEALIHFSEGDLEAAIAGFTAAAASGDDHVAIPARYNLATTLLKSVAASLAAGDVGDPADKIAILERSVSHLRDLVSQGIQDDDVKTNLLVAQRLLEQLRQPPTDEDAGAGPANQDPDRQDGPGQKEESNSSAENEDDSQDDSQTSDESAPPTNEMDGEPDKPEDAKPQPNPADSQSSDSSDPDSPSERSTGQAESESGEGVSEAADDDSDANEPSDPLDDPPPPKGSDSIPRGEPIPDSATDGAGTSQPDTAAPEPTEQETNAIDDQSSSPIDGELSARGDDPDDSPTVTEAQRTDPDELTPGQAAKLLQIIRDQQFMRKLLRDSRRPRTRIPVERDW